MPASNDLSEREQEILRLVATGASNKEIAQKLSISSNTVKVHLRNIFSKIGVASRTEAALYAINIGLTPVAQIEQVKPNDDVVEELIPEKINVTTLESLPIRENYKNLTKVWIVIGFIFVILSVGGVLIFLNWPFVVKQNNGLVVSPTESRWKRLAAMPTARSGLAVATYDNQIYAIGGRTEQGISGVLERYDPINDQWMRLADKPTPVRDIRAEVIAGKVFVPGGLLSSGEESSVLEIYDPRTNTWNAGNPLPRKISGYALTSYEGKLYLFGGKSNDIYLDSVYEYDPVTAAWEEKSPLPTARAYGSAVQAGGKIYVIGGFDGTQALKSNEIYTPDQDDGTGKPWTESAEMPDPRYGMGMAGIVDYILVIGGISGQEGAVKSYEYFIQAGHWQEFGEVGTEPWTYPGVVSLGTNLFILGGEVNGELTDLNLSYQAVYIINMPLINR